MTRTKLDRAKQLAQLRNDGSDPVKLAQEMTLSRLCYEIEKLEDAAAPAAPPAPKKKKGFLSFLDSDSD